VESHSTEQTAMPAVVIGNANAGTNARPAFFEVLTAPWLNVFRPGRAGATMVAARRRDFVITYLTCLLLLAATFVLVALWDEVSIEVWLPPPTPPGTAPATSPWAYGHTEFRYRSMAEIWQRWHRGEYWWFGPAEVIVLTTIVVGALGTAVLAWLYLFRVHRTGSVWASLCRSLRAVSPCLGLVTIGVLLFGAYFALRKLDVISVQAPRFMGDSFEPFSIVASLCLGLWWLSRAIRAIEREDAGVDLPPMCEGCGYNLTYQSAEGRCTECGMEVTESLTAGHRRRGSPWMRRRGIGTWLATAWKVLWSPSEFYTALQLRTPGSTERNFSVGNYAFVWVMAGGWGVVIFLLMGLKFDTLYEERLLEQVFVAFTMGLIVALASWAGQRIMAAIAATWWFMRKSLPDGRWAAKVIAYEAVFVWPFLIYLGLLAASFVLYEDWINQLFGRRPVRLPVFVPAEALAVLVVIPVYGVLSLGRFRIAWRAIRWSNF
jgi:hypothetical protein